ncbi:exonuclease V, chloroplastic [Impatiens glandulifera]|uniref:exonuclease V, chloroplastic n=1 Tax=Impatiens glandulifera TaxID=253017 RepID=UPI001FB156A3|nr:exonuclease V, chloroplastic [Impatiens glandulifera]
MSGERRPLIPTSCEEGGENIIKKKEKSQIQVEIVSEEEMAILEAALAFATRSSSSTSPVLFRQNDKIIRSISTLSKRRLSSEASPVRDIEDATAGHVIGSPQKTNRSIEPLLHRFRRKRGLSVTDFTKTEWCEKQMEFSLHLGKPEMNKAMKAGIARHAVLEEEVLKRVDVHVKTTEDKWALKFFNFIVGANQLLLDGMTRELPIIGLMEEDVWVVGVIDEIRLSTTEGEKYPMLVDTKTRVQATLPAFPQQRNGRLQLMCYKLLWDNLATKDFPWKKFFDFYALDSTSLLSEDIRKNTTMSGFPAETLDDLTRYFQNTCCTLLPASDQLLLRYELQEDNSLLFEDTFGYDSDWLKSQIKKCLEFWKGEREANYVPKEERWKCRYCQYASVCSVNSVDSTQK